PGRAVEHRAVGGAAAPEGVALDDALEPLALAHADDVDGVAGGEEVDGDLVPDLQLGAVLDEELPEDAAGRQPRLVEVALHGLGDPLDLAVLHEAELYRGVAVLLLRLALDDHARPRLDDGDGDRPPVLGVDLGHAYMLADDCDDRHCYFACSLPNALISTSTPAGSSSFMSASTVWGVGSKMSTRRLWVRISNCSRLFLSTWGERLTVQRLRTVGSG